MTIQNIKIKSIIKISLFILIISISILFQFFVTPFANATLDTKKTSILYVEKNQNIENKNELIVDLFIDPQNNLINVAGIYIDFATTTAIVEQINLNTEFCELVISKKQDNLIGKIEILCGTFHPIKEKIKFASIIFKEKKNNALITVNNKSVILAHDGYGTQVLEKIIQ